MKDFLSCSIPSEDNHLDISFQIPSASDNPNQDDLIIIMDAKYKENDEGVVPKSEVYKFGVIVDLFDLKTLPRIPIIFNSFKNLLGNCLLTNGHSYTSSAEVALLK
ncbi:MAG: hypothetical protein ACRYFB_11575 [Janthinobacterium lividum]